MVDFRDKDPSFQRLRRIDPSSLFYAPPLDRAAAPSPSPAAVEDARLPPTDTTFLPPGSNSGTGDITWMEIMRRNDDKIIAVDQDGRAIIYDPAKHTVDALPTMVSPKPRTLSLAVGKDLYVMAVSPHPDGVTERSFEALVRCKKPEWEVGDDCRWRPMPPPPYVRAADYEHVVGDTCAYAAVGDSHILLSSRRHGTYSFDTASSTWSKSGDWTLPFRDRAEYVPEHGLWFGFSAADDGVLGAWDLSSSTVQQSEPPPPAHHGCRDFAMPGPAHRKARQSHGIDLGDVTDVHSSHIVHLGDSKLCAAKLYKVSRRGTCSEYCCDSEWDERNFAVLTGVEVVRSHDDKLRIIRHKSQQKREREEEMIRRFLYMVYILDKAVGNSHLPYRLRCINPSHLFYPKQPKDEEVSSTTTVEDTPLPPTTMTFCGSTEFMRRNDDKIVGVDYSTRRAILYDPDEHTVRVLPSMLARKSSTQALAIGRDLYLMDMTPWPDKGDDRRGLRSGHSFEALIHRDPRPPDGACRRTSATGAPCRRLRAGGGKIKGYTVVGDSHILVSTQRYGTYYFDTVSSTWTKAGDWALPFCGRAEYVPEHGLWFGLSAADDDIFGAWDLSSTVQQQPPVVAHRGCEGFAVPETPYDSNVVHLGDGKLCTAKLFVVARRETCSECCCSFDRDRRFFAMLTGVEVVRCNGDKLRIIKHKSCRYSFGEHCIPTYQAEWNY
uniref:Uncharacterized protein n=1 Tax=Oryza punctata TaxID=4537 RepID=A0A0E0JVF7_ORYPU